MEMRHGYELASYGQRAVAYLLDVLLFFLTLVIGYIIWWAIVLGRAQTPGKQLVGIMVIKDNGEPCGWGYMFLREFVIKGVVGSVLSGFAGIYFVVDSIWPLFDDNRQTLHDKMVSTLVVNDLE